MKTNRRHDMHAARALEALAAIANQKPQVPAPAGGGHEPGAVHALPPAFRTPETAEVTVLVVISRNGEELVVCPAVLYPFRGMVADGRDTIVSPEDSPFRVFPGSGRMVVRQWDRRRVAAAALPRQGIAQLPADVVGRLG